MRFRTRSHIEPIIISDHTSGSPVGGKSTLDAAPVVTGAIVRTVAVTDCTAPPLICTEELDREQIGVEVTAGMMAQSRFTVPVNDPDDVSARLKLAVCPALMVCEVADPEAASKAKSGGSCTTSDTAEFFTVDPALPWTFTA